MKKIIALLMALAMVLSLAACGGNSAPATTAPAQNETQPAQNDQPAQNEENPLAGTYDITMWVSEKEGVAALFQSQIDAFEAANPGIVINASIEGVTEADAGSKVVADVASAPDIYCFAQDQLARLVQAAALAQPGKGAQETITANNDAGSVSATKVAGEIWAYPMTADNGYFMYYDKSIVTDPSSLEAIVAACEASNVKFRFALENAWYTAAFFFATGCHTTWTTDANGEFTSVDDTFNTPEGMTAMKGMQILAKSPCYDGNADIFTDAGVVVTGTWNAGAAAEHFGENLGAAKLPTFTVDGNTYQLGSYSGYKMMGVKPQSDAKRAAVLSQLVQYLTNEESQAARFAQFGWGPSNLNVQGSEAVQADLSLAALSAQNAFSTPQGQIAGVFWDNAKLLGAVAKNATTDEELQKGLDDYTAALDAFTSLTPEQRSAFTVIGGIKDTGWGTDFEMAQDPAGTWTSVEAFELTAGTEFKVRQGMGWKVAYGANEGNADLSIPLTDKPNYVVEADGTYYIQLVVAEDTTAVINLIPAE